MNLYCSEEALIQNLRDAGCDEKIIADFLKYWESGKDPEGLRLLRKQRSHLLDLVHEEQKKIDCLDYLVYQIQMQKTSR